MFHPDDRDIEDKLRAFKPELWRALYPRAYAAQGNYNSPKQAAVSMILNIMGQLMRPVTDMPTRYASLTCTRLAEFSVPTYFVSANLLHACLQTSLPDGFHYSDLRWPMPAMLFILPTGAVTSPTDGECRFIALARHSQGNRMEQVPGIPPFPNSFSYDCFSHYAFTSANATFAGYIPTHTNPMLADILSGEKHFSPGIVGVTPAGELAYATIEGSDGDFMGLTVSIGLRLMLLLNARPELLTPARELRKANPSPRKPTTALWSPNIIGGNFQVAAETANRPGRTPRLHWRRGHYRNQPHGPGFTQRKIVWIEPILVSAEAAPAEPQFE